MGREDTRYKMWRERGWSNLVVVVGEHNLGSKLWGGRSNWLQKECDNSLVVHRDRIGITVVLLNQPISNVPSPSNYYDLNYTSTGIINFQSCVNVRCNLHWFKLHYQKRKEMK